MIRQLIKLFRGGMAKVSVNGKTYEGQTITIYNNKVIVDGVDRTPDSLKVSITVDGNLDSISADVADKITVNGNVKSVKTASGDVLVQGDVTHGVTTTSGDIQVKGALTGNVTNVSGDINAIKINGDCKTVSGDIN